MRMAIILEYDGSGFSGWQSQSDVQQPQVRTVQDVVEAGLAKIADAPVRVIVAGRTDAGVHARAQVIHFDTDAVRTPYAWVRGGNSNLPPDVALRWAGEVDTEFHARFSATGRRYRYVILNRATRPALARAQVSWEYRPLDAARMQAGARHLVGTHDFSSFRALQCQAKSPVRELRELRIERDGEYVILDLYANAFLHHMVRNIAGVLMTIGAGEREPEWALAVLQARDRTQGGVTAPPGGLCLTAVEYPAHFDLPALP